MTAYLNINEQKEIFFPFNTENDVVEMVWKHDQSGNEYGVSVLKASASTDRGFSALITVTGTISEPYSDFDVETFATTLHIPSGDYTAMSEDTNGVLRIVMVHVKSAKEQTIYQNEQKNIVYNG